MSLYQTLRIPLFNGGKQESGLGELIIRNARAPESGEMIIIDPDVKLISSEIILYDTSKCFYNPAVLWNIRSKKEGQVSFYPEHVGTFILTEKGAKLDIQKPDSKNPFKLFLTFNYMSEFYNGVLFTPIPICDKELKQNKADIKHTIEETATHFNKAGYLRPSLGQLINIFGVDYYDEQEDLLAELLCDTKTMKTLHDNGNNSQSEYDPEQMVETDLASECQKLLIDPEKEFRFLAVFKSYTQIRFAIALIDKEYFYFDEEDVRTQLQSRKAGTFAIVFSKHSGLLACHYKSGGLYPETKYLGYFAQPIDNLPAQHYYYLANGQMVYSPETVEPSHEGFYQVEEYAPLSQIPIHYTVDDWIKECVELKYPL